MNTWWKRLAMISMLAAGAAFAFAKSLGLLVSVLCLKRLVRFDVEESVGLTLRWLLPLAAVLLALGASWVTWGRRSRFAGIEEVFGYASFGALIVIVFAVASRITSEVRRPTYEPGVSPWL